MARRTVSIVPHTHWDREWYSPFQTFRLRLVDLLDDLIPRLDADPSYAHFMLDGQMAVVDDYLAVRPEAEAVLRRLAAAGRLSVGPWYIPPGESDQVSSAYLPADAVFLLAWRAVGEGNVKSTNAA